MGVFSKSNRSQLTFKKFRISLNNDYIERYGKNTTL